MGSCHIEFQDSFLGVKRLNYMSTILFSKIYLSFARVLLMRALSYSMLNDSALRIVWPFCLLAAGQILRRGARSS